VWLPRLPPSLIGPALRLAGRERDFGRLFEPLQFDGARIRARLGWSPPFSLEEGLRRAVAPSRI
jgi:UDP-glucose 4-epimerase